MADEKFVEIRETIFKHLSFEDIIKASAVSKLWYSSTANSETCMEKIQINIGKDDKNESDLKASQRNYKNLKLHNFTSSIVEYLVKHNWARLNLLIGSINDKEFFRLLNIFAPSVTEIEFYLENVIAKEILPVVNFPHLETVVIRWTDMKIFEPFFGENENLKNVVIELKQAGTHENVKNFLCRNKTIKNLSMRLCHLDLMDFFAEDFSDQHQLQMETLGFYWKGTLFVERKLIKNLEKFFLTQKNCLQRLVYEGTFNTKSILELIINEMEALKHLTLVDLDPILTQEGEYNFKPNFSIEHIDVCVNWFVFDKVFEELIKATKNLEVLYIIELTLDTIKFLAENAMNLRHLIYEEIEEDCEEYYNNLILGSEDDDVVNSLIQISWEQDFEIDYPEIHSKLQFT